MVNLGFNRILATYTSSYSGQLHVKQEAPWGGDRYISTDQVTQSGWIVKDIWAPIINRFTHKHASWLILGVAGGTVPKLIAAKKSPSAMVGVEIDPVMIEIGKAYFGIDRIPNFQVVEADASKYVYQTTQKFDYVLVDMYMRDQLPPFVYTPKFLHRLHTLAPTVIFNHLYYTPENITSVQAFIKSLTPIFSKIELVRRRLNLFLICTSPV